MLLILDLFIYWKFLLIKSDVASPIWHLILSTTSKSGFDTVNVGKPLTENNMFIITLKEYVESLYQRCSADLDPASIKCKFYILNINGIFNDQSKKYINY